MLIDDMYAEMLDIKAEEIKDEVEVLRKKSVAILSELHKLIKVVDTDSELSKEILYMYSFYSGLYVYRFVLNTDKVGNMGSESLREYKEEVDRLSIYLKEANEKSKYMS